MNKFVIFLFLIFFSLQKPSQGSVNLSLSSYEDSRTCMYINLNKLNEGKVIDLYDSIICFEYEESKVKEQSFEMLFLDWESNKIAGVKLVKKYGLNTYKLDLTQLGIKFEKQVFTARVLSGDGKHMDFIFRLVPPPVFEKPLIDIYVNPITMKCDSVGGNLVEFYGEIKGGKAPYNINWQVLDESQSNQLYKPKNVVIKEKGYTPSIQVDKLPSYVVLLHVKDACGVESKQAVSITCTKNKDKSNSIMYQPIQIPISPSNSKL
jgi:hypothetical protein